MNRLTAQDGMDFQRGTVHVDMVFTAGASGHAPTALTHGAGIKSVSDNGSGVYTVTFQDGYVAYLNGYGHVIQASYSSSGACSIKPSAQAAATGTPTVTLTCYTAAGAAVQLSSGDEVHFTFRLKRSK